jgi:drug/metabolite transporter (DMT)-like permease
VSAFWFSLMSLGVKTAGRRLPIQEVVLVRGVVTLALSWAVLRRAGLAVRVPGRGRQGLLVLRGLFGTAGLTCFYASLARLPLAEATLLQYTNPLWAAALAALVLGERARPRDLLALAAGARGRGDGGGPRARRGSPRGVRRGGGGVGLGRRRSGCSAPRAARPRTW